MFFNVFHVFLCFLMFFNIFDVLTSDSIKAVDDQSEQNWYGTNEYGNIYYYPVLPKLNKLAMMDENKFGLQGGGIPFGDKLKWDGEDKAPVTLTKPSGEYTDRALLDVNFEEIDKKMVGDNSGNEVVGMLMSDYMVKYEGRGNKVKKVKPKNKMKLDKRKKKKAF